MALLANSICFSQPFAKLGVHITWFGQPEGVNMITRRNGLDRAEARMLEPPRQHDMAVEPIRPRCDLGKGHTHLKSNPSLLWKDAHLPKLANRRNDLIENGSNFRPLATEVVFKIVPAARVRLVAVCEVASAFLTLPQAGLFYVDWIRNGSLNTSISRGGLQAYK